MLADGQARGAVGPGPLDEQVRHALGFFARWAPPRHACVVDLGSGGGLPALPLALAYPESRWLLVEARSARADALGRAIGRLRLTDRVEVRMMRVEVLAHGDGREQYDVVTARSFGPAATTVECAAPLLRPGGSVVVSERPSGGSIWPESGLARVGLVVIDRWESPAGRYARLARTGPVPEAVPRAVAVRRRDPLW